MYLIEKASSVFKDYFISIDLSAIATVIVLPPYYFLIHNNRINRLSESPASEAHGKAQPRSVALL